MIVYSTWTPELDDELKRRRGALRQKWSDIAFIMGRSKRVLEERYKKLVQPVRRLGTPLHRELGIATHVHRQALLADSRVGLWDEQEHVWSHDHRYREAISLAGA